LFPSPVPAGSRLAADPGRYRRPRPNRRTRLKGRCRSGASRPRYHLLSTQRQTDIAARIGSTQGREELTHDEAENILDADVEPEVPVLLRQYEEQHVELVTAVPINFD
jgi:hypothetical protein